MDTNIEKEFNELIAVIKEAGKTAREYFDSDDFSNEEKSDGSVVTEIDKSIERTLRTFIDDNFPDDAIVGEEEENKVGTSGFVWHIDPIDGTGNFLRKIPFCAISVARLGGTPEDSFGIVYNPITDHLFSSLMEGGTYENERITKLTAEPLCTKMVVTIGRGNKEGWMKSAKYSLMASVGKEFGSCLSYNCTALELAYLSAGRVDAYLTFGLNTYDYAAGFYLVKAAGGMISVFEGGEWVVFTGSIKELCSEYGKIIFASHPDIHDEIRDFIGDPKSHATE